MINCKHLLFFLLLSFASSTHAVKYHGSMSLGSYIAKERHSELSDGSDANDFATASGRLYLNIYDISKKQRSVRLDLRDKFDFFGKLDRANKQLNSENTLYLRQLYFDQSNTKLLIKKVGRFSVFNAGSTFVDGIEMSWRKNKKIKWGGFLGFNPRSPDKIELAFNSDSQIAGFYFNYKKESRNLYANYLDFTGAVVAEVNFGELDRNYYYQNFVYQISRKQRLFSLLYLDFVPRVYIQNGFISYDHTFKKDLSANFSLSAIDVIEFRRRQSIRETITPSPYQEVQASVRYRKSRNVYLSALTRHGKRETDGLRYAEYSLGLRLPRFFNKKIDFISRLGHRKQFTHTGLFARLGLGYFSKKWELGANLDYSSAKDQNEIKISPLVFEASIARYISKKIFASFVAQYGKDEQTTIQSYFFKIGYRFGKKETPPLRSGAPPRGSL